MGIERVHRIRKIKQLINTISPLRNGADYPSLLMVNFTASGRLWLLLWRIISMRDIRTLEQMLGSQPVGDEPHLPKRFKKIDYRNFSFHSLQCVERIRFYRAILPTAASRLCNIIKKQSIPAASGGRASAYWLKIIIMSSNSFSVLMQFVHRHRVPDKMCAVCAIVPVR